MFAKHSFGVKYLFEILPDTHPRIVSVTPQEHTSDMTAALIPTPILTGSGVAAGQPRPVSPEVYRRRRLAALAMVLGLVLGIASFGRQADATPTAEAEAAEAVLVVVQPGDTLWSIAQTLVSDTDPRPLVAELSEIAGGASIQPGQLLRIPGDLVG
jgi:LysM repeat protein